MTAKRMWRSVNSVTCWNSCWRRWQESSLPLVKSSSRSATSTSHIHSRWLPGHENTLTNQKVRLFLFLNLFSVFYISDATWKHFFPLLMPSQLCLLLQPESICHSGDRSVVRVPDLWLKGRGFKSLKEQWEIFLLQGRLSVLTLISISIPPLCYPKRSPSFCQKCRWQVTAKHTYTLRMWLCMNWHSAWLYGVHRTCAEMAAVSCGTSHASAVSTPHRWILKNPTTHYKKLVTHVEPHASTVSLLKRVEDSTVQAINQSINR